MTQDRVGVACPACSPAEATVHDVLTNGPQATVQCQACGHTHKVDLSDPPMVDRTVVVSQEGDSFSTTEALPADESLEVGDEFLLETPEAIHVVRVTSLEREGDQRVESSDAEAVETIWTRVVDNVVVDVTVHPPGGDQQSQSVELRLPGDREVAIGEELTVDDMPIAIERIHVRDEAPTDAGELLEQPGETAQAKDCKRVYARSLESAPWSPW